MASGQSGFSADEITLLGYVPEDGSRVGNTALQRLLNWPDDRFERAKGALVCGGVLVRARGRGGSVMRSLRSSRSRLNSDKAARRGNGTSTQGEADQIPQKLRKKLAEILYRAVPRDGTTLPNHTVRENVQGAAKKQFKIDVSDRLYFEIRNELIDEGLLGKAGGQGGSVYRTSPETEKKPGKAKRLREAELYAPVKDYIEKAWVAEKGIKHYVLEETAKQGRKNKVRGTWTRPDFALVASRVYTFFGKKVELITFEVKPADDFRIEGVYETSAQSKAAHRSYLMIHTPMGRPDKESDKNRFQRIVEECERHKLGLIIFNNPQDPDTYETVREADERRDPDLGEVDNFIKNQMKRHDEIKALI